MKLRCECRVNGGERTLQLMAGPNEPGEHLALKLAACLLFWDREPILDASPKTPGLEHFDFSPDLIAKDAAGDVTLWVECGSTTMNKLDKLPKRLPRARIVVLKETIRDAERLRRELDAAGMGRRIEILAWPDGAFRAWAERVGEKTEAYGEAGELSLNLVLNGHPVCLDLRKI